MSGMSTLSMYMYNVHGQGFIQYIGGKGVKLPPLTTKLPLLAASLPIKLILKYIPTQSETTRDHSLAQAQIFLGEHAPLALESSSFKNLPP